MLRNVVLKENVLFLYAAILLLGFFAGVTAERAAIFFTESKYRALKDERKRRNETGKNRTVVCCFPAFVVILFLRAESVDGFIFDVCFIWLLCCLTMTDLTVHKIPNECLCGIAAVWIVSSLWMGTEWEEALKRIMAAMLTMWGVLIVLRQTERFFGKECLGRGDIKLLGAVMLYLGTEKALWAFWTACLSGGVYLFLTGMVFRKRKEAFPFGPFIAASAFVMLF